MSDADTRNRQLQQFSLDCEPIARQDAAIAEVKRTGRPVYLGDLNLCVYPPGADGLVLLVFSAGGEVMNWVEFWGFGRQYPYSTPMYPCITMAPPARTYAGIAYASTEDQKALAAALRKLMETCDRGTVSLSELSCD